MGYYLSLYASYFKIALKVMVQYRVDLGIMIASTVLREGSILLFLSFIFSQIDHLRGWGFYEIVLILGLNVTTIFLTTIFLDMPNSLTSYVQYGQIDILLVRPPRPLFQILGDRCLNLSQAGSFAVGICITIFALNRIGLPFQAWWLLYIPVAIISGAIIIFSLTLIFACTAFWFTHTTAVLMPLTSLAEFARYPPQIFEKPIQFTLTWVLPYAMTGFYPAAFLLGKEGYSSYGLLVPPFSIIFLTFAILTWSIAIRYYQSTGS